MERGYQQEKAMLEFQEPVLLIGGGRVDTSQIIQFGEIFPLVAADSGADVARSCGIEPVAVIGDMDSISSPEAYPSSQIMLTPDQARTDFDKTLSAVQAPLVLGLGFLGRRLDHTLAAMNTLARHHPRPVILLDQYDAVIFCRGDISLDLASGDRVSIWPMEGQLFKGSEGLKWSLEGLSMRPGGQIGTSNHVATADGRVVIESGEGDGYLIMLESTSLAALVGCVAPAWEEHIKGQERSP